MAREAPYLQSVNLTELSFKVTCMSEQPITFIVKENIPLIHPYIDTIFVDLQIEGRRVFWILVDNRSSADILFTLSLNRMNLFGARLEPIHTPLHGFTRPTIYIDQILTLPMELGE